MRQTFTKIVLSPAYLALTLGVGFVVLSFLVFVPNRMLVWFGLSHGGGGVAADLGFLLAFYGSLLTNFTPLAAVVAVVTALLMGLNVSLLTYYVRLMRGSGRTTLVVSGLSLGGFVSAVFGIGCAVCGSIIVTSVLSLVGASGLLLLLPYGGEEFSFLAVLLLAFATVMLLRQIEAGRVC